MTQMTRPGNRTQVSEYLIERVSDLAGRPVPRKTAVTWLEVMAGLITVGIVVVIVRLTVQ
jgi:hypothetical protein